MGRGSGCAKAKVADSGPKSSESAAFSWSGRLDLNQRPLAPQSRLQTVQPVVLHHRFALRCPFPLVTA